MKKRIYGAVLAGLMIMTVFTACGSGSTSSTTSSSMPEATVSPAVSPSTSPEGSDGASVSSQATATTHKIEDFREKMKEVYAEDYLPDRTLTEAEIDERTGLKKEMYDEVFAEASTLDENPDIFIAVKAKSGKEDEVEKILNDYKAKMLSDNKYAANNEKITAAEVVKENGYVFLGILGKNELGTDGQDMGEAFKNEMKKGMDAIKSMFTA